jgi:hypothetical protein
MARSCVKKIRVPFMRRRMNRNWASVIPFVWVSCPRICNAAQSKSKINVVLQKWIQCLQNSLQRTRIRWLHWGGRGGVRLHYKNHLAAIIGKLPERVVRTLPPRPNGFFQSWSPIGCWMRMLRCETDALVGCGPQTSNDHSGTGVRLKIKQNQIGECSGHCGQNTASTKR